MKKSGTNRSGFFFISFNRLARCRHELEAASDLHLAVAASVQRGILLRSEVFFEGCVDGAYESIEQEQKRTKREIKDTRNDVECDVGWGTWEKGCCMSHNCDIKITEIAVK